MKCSFEQWCKDNGHQDWLDLWDYTLNDKNPNEVSCCSHIKHWFKCKRELHNSEAYRISDFCKKKKSISCRKCASFGQWLIDSFGDNAIQKYWSALNTIGPFLITQKSGRKIFIKCSNCNDHPDYLIDPAHFVNGCRCPTCAGKQIIIGVNDIGTVRPDVAKLFFNYDDRFRYTAYSGKRTLFKCPNCGNVINSAINNVSCFGLSCPKCSDGVSYPNKFIYNLIEQISMLHKDKNIIFKPEKIFEWSKDIQHKNLKLSGDKRYDFCIYFNGMVIVEVQGIQHYKESFLKMSKKARTLAEEQENDKLKMELAINNGIFPQNYIQLDCRCSNMDYIKNSIMSSSLPILLDFTEEQIDWHECNKFATSSRIFEACELWNNGIRMIKDISSLMRMDRHTIRKYLYRGFELGILQDPPKYLLEI